MELVQRFIDDVCASVSKGRKLDFVKLMYCSVSEHEAFSLKLLKSKKIAVASLGSDDDDDDDDKEDDASSSSAAQNSLGY